MLFHLRHWLLSVNNPREMFELAFIMAILGVVFFIAGFVGRRMGMEPRCKPCGYDLSGLVTPGQPPTGLDSPPTPCPECGIDLRLGTTAPGDLGSPIRFGRRKRRRGAMLLGLVLLLPSSLILGYAGVSILAGPSWNDRKAVSILIFEARRFRGDRADAAITELYTRLIEERATVAQQRAIIDAALDIQRSEPDRWFGTPYNVLLSWGTLFDIAARQNGAATPEQARAYAQNALAIRFEHRSRARPGDQWPLGIIIDRARVAGHMQPFVRPVLEELTIGPWTLDVSTIDVTGTASAPHGRESTRFNAAVVSLGDIPLGRHDVRQKWSINVHEVAGPGIGPLIGTWTAEITSTVLVQPRGFETVEVYQDADLMASMSSELLGPVSIFNQGNPSIRRVDVILTRCYADIACGVTLIGDHGELAIGQLTARRGQLGMTYQFPVDWPASLGEPRRLRLQTSTDAARATPDLERILDVDITLDLAGPPTDSP